MRLIDADTLKEKWTIASPEPYSTDTAEVLDSIEAAHTIDAVPVVRCRECKYWKHNLENDTYCSGPDGLSDPEEDDFCSYGHRKEASHEVPEP